MMDVDPVELSALLDGELDPDRTQVLRQIMETDPSARAAFERLKRADQELTAIARIAAFEPRVRLPRASSMSWPKRAGFGLGFIAIIIAWAVAKLDANLVAELAVNVIAMLVLLASIGLAMLPEVELRRSI